MQAESPHGVEAVKISLIRKFDLALVYLLVVASAASASAQLQNGSVLLTPQPRTLLQGPANTCTIAMLNLRITTGKDDLRGGKNNLDVEVHFANGDMQTAPNVNRGENWPNDSVSTVAIQLNHPVPPDQIRQIRLVHSAQAGYNAPTTGQVVGASTPVGAALAPVIVAEGVQSEDNWDMTELQAFGLGKGSKVPIASFGFHRFTGGNPSLDINAHPAAGCPAGNQVTAISFTFKTSDDDLRGGKDNLNITVLFADGTSQSETNVNHSQNWPNGSTKGAEIQLNHAVDIKSNPRVHTRRHILGWLRRRQLEYGFYGSRGHSCRRIVTRYRQVWIPPVQRRLERTKSQADHNSGSAHKVTTVFPWTGVEKMHLHLLRLKFSNSFGLNASTPWRIPRCNESDDIDEVLAGLPSSMSPAISSALRV